jgi:hypothetical protein
MHAILDFDPFHLDGHCLLQFFEPIADITRNARNLLEDQNTTGPPNIVRNKIVEKLNSLMGWIESLHYLSYTEGV